MGQAYVQQLYVCSDPQTLSSKSEIREIGGLGTHMLIVFNCHWIMLCYLVFSLLFSVFMSYTVHQIYPWLRLFLMVRNVRVREMCGGRNSKASWFWFNDVNLRLVALQLLKFPLTQDGDFIHHGHGPFTGLPINVPFDWHALQSTPTVWTWLYWELYLSAYTSKASQSSSQLCISTVMLWALNMFMNLL